MKASSLSGECANRSEAVLGVAVCVDISVTILALLETSPSAIC